MSPGGNRRGQKPESHALPTVLEDFPKPLSLLAELADCGGCIIDSCPAGDQVIRIYVPSQWEALVSIVNTLNRGNVRWDNYLVDKVEDLLEVGAAIIPEQVCLDIATAIHNYIKAGTQLKKVISLLHHHLFDRMTLHGSYSKSNRRMISDFVKLFCQQCEDCYRMCAHIWAGPGQGTNRRQLYESRRLIVFKRCTTSTAPSAVSPRVAMSALVMKDPVAVQATEDIPKLLTGFLRQFGSTYATGSSSLEMKRQKILQAGLQQLCRAWNKIVLLHDAQDSRELQDLWAGYQSKNGLPPLLCEYLSELVLLHHAGLPRRGVVKYVRSVLNEQRTLDVTELTQAIAISDKNILATLDGRLPEREKSFQILVVDGTDRRMLRRIPQLRNFGSAAGFVSGFLEYFDSSTRSYRATRQIYEDLAAQKDLPRWWDSYFKAGESTSLIHLRLKEGNPVAACQDVEHYGGNLSAWVCKKEIGNNRTLTSKQFEEFYSWSNELDIIFNNSVQRSSLVQWRHNQE